MDKEIYKIVAHNMSKTATSSSLDQLNESIINSPGAQAGNFGESGIMKGLELHWKNQQENAVVQIELLNRQIELLNAQKEHLSNLLKSSENAIEQRNVIIKFMVESIVNSEQSKENKFKQLLELSVQFTTIATGATDLIEMIKKSISQLT